MNSRAAKAKPKSTSLLKRPQGNLKSTLDLKCPVCGRGFSKSMALTLSAHVETCLFKSEEKMLLHNNQNTNQAQSIVILSSSDNEEEVANPIRPSLHQENLAVIKVDESSKPITTSTLPAADANGAAASRQKRPCPFYKMISPTSFSVDAFSYGKIDRCSAYFLSHFHSDHYMGLNGKFDFGPIYCSPITASLVISQLKVKAEFVNIIPLNTLVTIQGVSVRLLDANHCPGAVIFLFEIPLEGIKSGMKSLKYIHTGDFRASPFHWTDPLLINSVWEKVYLDTTYCKPSHTFPDQQIVLDIVAEIAVRVHDGESFQDIISPSKLKQFFSAAIINVDVPPIRKKRTLFVVGSYLIGKEKVWVSIALKIKSKVYSEKRKMKVYKLLADHDPILSDLLTEEKNDADVYVVPMAHVNYENLLALKGTYDQIIAFRPTGWTFTQGKAVASTSSGFTVKSLKPSYMESGITVIPVPYSEHSSFQELSQFCTKLNIKQIIPTVNLDAKSRGEMTALFKNWVS